MRLKLEGYCMRLALVFACCSTLVLISTVVCVLRSATPQPSTTSGLPPLKVPTCLSPMASPFFLIPPASRISPILQALDSISVAQSITIISDIISSSPLAVCIPNRAVVHRAVFYRSPVSRRAFASLVTLSTPLLDNPPASCSIDILGHRGSLTTTISDVSSGTPLASCIPDGWSTGLVP
jgi:hypothetical protein